MENTNLQKIRSANLANWFNGKKIPEKEKSLISRAINGKISLGERLARRLETDYNMPTMHLDKVIEGEISSIIEDVGYYIESIKSFINKEVKHLTSDVHELVKSIRYDRNYAKTIFNDIPDSNLKVINIASDGMSGTFNAGDFVFINSAIKNFMGDGIYLFEYGLGLYVKRLQLIKNKIHVISDNKSYKEWELEAEEINQLVVYGKVVVSLPIKFYHH